MCVWEGERLTILKPELGVKAIQSVHRERRKGVLENPRGAIEVLTQYRCLELSASRIYIYDRL